eukprot:jgi/Tetstr1/443777/TSEL_031765.t1
MAKELRKSRGEELFAVAVREVFDAVAELRTDQSTEWTEELKESLMEFADIIAEPTDLPPEREFDFEINLKSDEPPKERTYRMSPAELQEAEMRVGEAEMRHRHEKMWPCDSHQRHLKAPDGLTWLRVSA